MTPLGCVGDTAMSELEFQRALSPDQLHEALSLLDSTAGAQPLNLHVGNVGPAKEVDPGADQANTTMVMQKPLPAAEDAQQHREHLNLAAGFYCLGLAATAALTLLTWSERAFAPSHYGALPAIPGEQVPNQQPAPLVNSGFPALPVINPTSDQSTGSERWRSTPEVIGRRPVDAENRADDQAAVKDATSRASPIPHAAETATVAAIATRQAWSDEPASRKPKEVSPPHPSAVRSGATKKHFSRRHSQPVTEINGGQCFLAACLSWQKRRVFYEPPRNVTQ